MKKAVRITAGVIGFIFLLALTASVAIWESLMYVLAISITWFSNNKHSEESIAQQAFKLTPVFFGWAKEAADWTELD